MRMIAALIAVALVSKAALAEACHSGGSPNISQETVFKLAQLYSDYAATIKGREELSSFLLQLKRGDTFMTAGRAATIIIGSGVACMPDTCNVQITIEPDYLRQVLDDALAKRLVKLRCSIMELGGQPPH